MRLIESLMHMAQIQPPMHTIYICFTDKERWKKCTRLAEEWWDEARIRGSGMTTGGIDMEFSIDFPLNRSKIHFVYCRSWSYTGDVFNAYVGEGSHCTIRTIDDDSVDIVVDTEMDDLDRSLMHAKGILDIEPVVVNLSDGMVDMLADI